jgi:phosphatidylglycerophosphate synthase
MELHRTGKKADWELIPQARWNSWQRLASRTHKIVTPGNIVSLLGLTLVCVGLVFVAQQRLWAGFTVIAVGRIFDILDGIAADRTGTKSHIGEAVDAGFDKIAAFAALIVFTASHILPWPFAVAIGALSIITALFSLLADLLGRTIHPNIAGKVGTAVLWAALAGFVLGAASHKQVWNDVAGILAIVAIALSTSATIHYMHGALRARKRHG